ncbi:MAG: hypothetical protein DRJ98_04345 [Thermoprotei archaeon]|nr:MAG: hypothetical protein DRJ98_04345 [Thermoprotei archaeon]RLF13274.1 MAG: hypothetical protein DRN06_08895 [Thermoprotei archaeon]
MKRKVISVSARKIDLRTGWVVVSSSGRIMSFHRSKKGADKAAERMKKKGKEVNVYRIERGLLAPV